MAREKKNTHIIANSWLDYWKALADAGMTEESNELMVAMNYMFMGLEYEIKNPAVRLAFEIFIKSQYEQNEKHYQESCDAKSEAALKREANKRAKKAEKADEAQKPQATTKSTTVLDDHKKHNCDDNDNEYDNDCDNDNDSLSYACAREEVSNQVSNQSQSSSKLVSSQSQVSSKSDDPEPDSATALPDMPDYGMMIEEVVGYLNIVAHKGYRVTAPIADIISRRLDEGFTVDELKSVIDKKYAEWKGTPRQNFVRPETLFSDAHFQSYLNQDDTIAETSRSGTTVEAEEASDDDVARIQAAMLKRERKAAGI